MWYIYILEYYLAIKRHEIMKFACKWMKPETIIWSEVTPTQKDNITYSLSFMNVKL